MGGIHSSLEEPSLSTMFVQAGKGASATKKDDSSNITDASTQAAVAIATISSFTRPVCMT